MARSISGSVGLGGVNRKTDSMTVQELLNNVAPEEGGPIPALKVDGLPWQKTIAAIKTFQREQCGFTTPDGRVDPNGRTLARLNEFDDAQAHVHSVRPGRYFLV
jgi:peptidoglycan hydrolase-like protein with peptidoglycan-binding domain